MKSPYPYHAKNVSSLLEINTPNRAVSRNTCSYTTGVTSLILPNMRYSYYQIMSVSWRPHNYNLINTVEPLYSRHFWTKFVTQPWETLASAWKRHWASHITVNSPPPDCEFTSPCYNQPQVGRPKFRLKTISTVVWLYADGVGWCAIRNRVLYPVLLLVQPKHPHCRFCCILAIKEPAQPHPGWFFGLH